MNSRFPTPLCLAVLLSGLVARTIFAADTLEDPVARAALPEIKIIPAATPEELTPALSVPIGIFRTWPRSQGDNGSRRYSALQQIDKSNVHQLEMAWTYRSGDGAQNIQCTPIIVDGVMYAPTPGYALVAVDAASGQEKWRLQIEVPAQVRNHDLVARRGLVYWPGDQDHGPRLLFGSGEWFYAADPATGKLIPDWGENGRRPIATGATVSGAVYRHVFVTAGARGDVYGYDVRTGKQLWRFSSVAQGGEFGEPWSTSIGAANGWAGLSVDDDRGMVFVTIGAPHPDMVGKDRPGDNLFSDCILALDILSGEYRWHFQGVRHDIWDLDVTGPPNLVTITRDGRKIDAVTAVSKGGLLLMVDRGTGKPIFLEFRCSP